MKKALIIFCLLIFTCQIPAMSWGFFGHRRINRMAVFTLPPEMVGFYKKHIQYITENAVNPDRRRYAVEGEAPRHYIDIDIYGDSAVYTMPRRWKDAVAKYTEDTLQAYGIVPWHVFVMKRRLTAAFKAKSTRRILSLSADLGHYIGDNNVPLHTTENYNGQMSGQYGIHGFWESRLPELLSDQYNFFFEKAKYEEKPLERAWNAVVHAHAALDSVFGFEIILTEKMGADKKYSFETRGGITTKVYSKDFSIAYHRMLNGQVERRMRASIEMVGDFWYTCWVDAGQPNLDEMIGLSQDDVEEMEKEVEDWRNNRSVKSRSHSSIDNLKNTKSPRDICSHHETLFILPSKEESSIKEDVNRN